jgi:protein-S-isoprenylcysteine O-methyltransferase Ste14
MPTVPQLALSLLLVLSFVHFLHAGARTFVSATDAGESGGGLAAFSFTGGAIIALFACVYFRSRLYNEIASAVLAACAIGLYEWARRTIAGRRFHVGLSQGVPEELCEAGPYAYIRHPVYTAYMLAFLALFVAYPGIVTGVALVLNIALFGYMATFDEKVIATSSIAVPYAAYRKRVGRFMPRLGARRTRPAT